MQTLVILRGDPFGVAHFGLVRSIFKDFFWCWGGIGVPSNFFISVPAPKVIIFSPSPGIWLALSCKSTTPTSIECTCDFPLPLEQSLLLNIYKNFQPQAINIH
jgi:hypothetical protein